MISRQGFDALSERQKFERLYDLTVAAERATAALAATVDILLKQLEAIERKRPGSPS